MNIFSARKYLVLLVSALLCMVLCGCGPGKKKMDSALEKPKDLDTTVGELVGLYESGAVSVHGFGIVAGLAGTGSSECPQKLRAELKKYILKQTVGANIGNPDNFINSPNTAVVEIYGVIPTLGTKGEPFDLLIAPLPGTQTTSLAGGRLYTAELSAFERFFGYGQYSKTLALGAGPVFINKIQGGNGKVGNAYVLAGGKIVEEVSIRLILDTPNYYTANAIRNKINERFGANPATAMSHMEIRLTVPPQYAKHKGKFLTMVQSLYLGTSTSLEQKRIASLINDLAQSGNKDVSEISLETIGKRALNSLATLLEHPDPEVRFRSARCMLNIGDERGMTVLRQTVQDTRSLFRISAIKAIGRHARRSEVSSILMRVLDDNNLDVTLTAYEQLRSIKDATILSQTIAGDFVLDSVISKGPRRIIAYRTGVPRIVIFGAPMYCSRNMFIQSSDGKVMINSRPTDEFVTMSRKHPRQATLIGPARSNHKVSEVIRALGEIPVVSKTTRKRPGLGVSYSEIIAILETMCKTGVIDADFIAGAMAEFPRMKRPEPNLEIDKQK